MSQAHLGRMLVTLMISFSILTVRQEVGKRHFPLPIGKTYCQLPCHQTPLSPCPPYSVTI
jgi:hypothetical protein